MSFNFHESNNPNAQNNPAFGQFPLATEYQNLKEMMGQGIPNEGELMKAGAEANHGWFLKTIKDVYSGSQRQLANIVTETNRSWRAPYFDVCPVSFTNNLDTRIITKVDFPQHADAPISPFAMVRQIEWHETKREFNFGGRGIGFSFESNWLKTPGANDTFRRLWRAVGQATCLSAQLMVIKAMEDTHEQTHLMNIMTGNPCGNIADLLKNFNRFFLILNKCEKGVWALLDHVTELRAANDADKPTRAFGPQGIKAQLAWGSDYMTEQYRSGGNVMSKLEQGSEYFRTIDGITFFEQAPIYIHNMPSPLQPFVNGLTVSWFFESNNDYLRAHDAASDTDHHVKKWRAVTRMDLGDNGSMKTTGIEEIIKADQSFDASGALRTDIFDRLAADYDTLMGTQEMDMQWSVSENKVPLLDPHISDDGDNNLFTITHFGQQDPAFCGFDSIESAATIDTNQMTRNFGERGQRIMQEIQEMFDILDQAANYSIPQTTSTAGHIEFSAAATVLLASNQVSGLTLNSIRGQTPGNRFGCDNLYPLDSNRQYGVRVDPATVRPVVFVTLDETLGINVEDSRISSSYFTVAGPDADRALGGAGDLGATGFDRDSIETKLIAPEFPPGFSCLTHAAYIASLVGSNDANYRSWVNGSAAARDAFAAVARGWNSYKLYWQQQREVFSPQLRSVQLTNPLMAPENCPNFMRPTGASASDEYLSQVGYGTTTFLGTRLPLAVATQTTRDVRTFTVASGGGVSFAIAAGTHNAAWQALYAAPGEQRNNYPAFSSTVDRESMVRGLFGNIGANPSEAEAQRVVDSLYTSDVTSAAVKEALRRDGGLAFAREINNTSPDFTFRSTAATANFSNTVKLFFAPQDFSDQMRGQSIADMLIGPDPSRRTYAALFINHLYDSYVAAPTQQRFNAAVFSNVARSALDRMSTYQGAAEGRDSTRPGTRNEQRVLEAQALFNRESGVLRPSAAGAGYDRTTPYLISRLSTSGNTFKSTTAARAYTSIIHPVLPTDHTRVMNAYALNTNSAFATIANPRGGIRIADFRDNNRQATITGLYGPILGFDGVPEASEAEHLRTHARAGFGDAWDDTGFGAHSNAYQNDTFVPTENYDVAAMFAGESDPTHFYADIMLLGGTLYSLVLQSRWMADRITRVGQLSDRMVRAMALTIITSRVHRHIYEGCVRKKYVLLRTYLLFCPFIDLAVGSLIFANDNIGKTEYSFPDVSVGFDANTLGFHVRVSYQMGSYVINDKNITIIPAVILKSYQGGASSRLIAAGSCKSGLMLRSQISKFGFDYNVIDKRQGDVFVFCTGSDFSILSNELPLSGRLDSAVFRGNMTPEAVEQLSFQQYPCAAYANLCCGFNQMGLMRNRRSVNASEGINELLKLTVNSRVTPICYRGPQTGYNPVSGRFDEVICSGRGPFGELSVGCGGVFSGGLGLFNKGPSLTQTYGSTLVPAAN